jgi:hypothetical protein
MVNRSGTQCVNQIMHKKYSHLICTYRSAHRQDDCRQNILQHLQNSGRHHTQRALGTEDPIDLAADAEIHFEECLHFTESLLIERS